MTLTTLYSINVCTLLAYLPQQDLFYVPDFSTLETGGGYTWCHNSDTHYRIHPNFATCRGKQTTFPRLEFNRFGGKKRKKEPTAKTEKKYLEFA